MAFDQLLKMLRELRHEVEQAEEMQDTLRQELRAAVQEIEQSSDVSTELLKPAHDRLVSLLVHLEVDHPDVMAVVDRVIRQLSRMGI